MGDPALPTSRPIETVAQKLRELRRTIRIVHASPELLRSDDGELAALMTEYDHWLAVASRQIDVPPSAEFVTPSARRASIEASLAAAGWVLDPDGGTDLST